MSVTSGFFNSLNGDRKYDAENMASIFDGLIIDGIFASIGNAFAVSIANYTNGIISVGTGKAWFNHTWTVNDAALLITLPAGHSLLNRYDAVVLEINKSTDVRANSIKCISGTAATNPEKPTLENSDEVHQYALAYIYRHAGTSAISKSDITSMIGKTATPFVTGILQTVSLDELLGQWEGELDDFIAEREDVVGNWISQEESTYTTWMTEMKTDLESEQKLLDEWVASEKSDFLAWYEEMKGKLSDDVAGNLQLEIDKETINRILVSGLEDGSKAISSDGSTITTGSDGRMLTKTFSSDYLTVTTVLKSAAGAEVARSVKTFSADGSTINTVVTYY